MTDHDEFMDPGEASAYTRLSRAALAQLRYKGTGPKFMKPTSKTVLYRKSDIDSWLQQSERFMTSAPLSALT